MEGQQQKLEHTGNNGPTATNPSSQHLFRSFPSQRARHRWSTKAQYSSGYSSYQWFKPIKRLSIVVALKALVQSQ
jgi:hypothetical protein